MDLGVFPQWSEKTTYEILSSMGFKWIADHQIDCAAIIERDEIKKWREIFLTKMAKFRREGILHKINHFNA